jgi:hypothetical protein
MDLMPTRLRSGWDEQHYRRRRNGTTQQYRKSRDERSSLNMEISKRVRPGKACQTR